MCVYTLMLAPCVPSNLLACDFSATLTPSTGAHTRAEAPPDTSTTNTSVFTKGVRVCVCVRDKYIDYMSNE